MKHVHLKWHPVANLEASNAQCFDDYKKRRGTKTIKTCENYKHLNRLYNVKNERFIPYYK